MIFHATCFKFLSIDLMHVLSCGWVCEVWWREWKSLWYLGRVCIVAGASAAVYSFRMQMPVIALCGWLISTLLPCVGGSIVAYSPVWVALYMSRVIALCGWLSIWAYYSPVWVWCWWWGGVCELGWVWVLYMCIWVLSLCLSLSADTSMCICLSSHIEYYLVLFILSSEILVKFITVINWIFL